MLGFCALGILPVDYDGILLLVLAVGLSIAELSTASFAVLTAGGIVAVIVGSLILFRGGTLLAINPVLIVVAVVIAAFLVWAVREAMPISVLPKTSLGRWSVGSAIAFILCMVLTGVLTGFDFDPSSGSNLALSVIWTIVVVGTSGASFATGLISVIKRKERSVLVFVSVAITLWGLLGMVGEFLI